MNNQIDEDKRVVGKVVKSFDDTEIYYEIKTFDSKQPHLVFLHGLGGDLTAWNKEREFFHRHKYSTIAVDLRGHGMSGRPQDINKYHLKNFAKDIHTIINIEKVKKPVIIGHCFGGMVTMTLEAMYPKVSDTLVLIDTNYKTPFISNSPMEVMVLQSIIKHLATVTPEIAEPGHTDFSKFVNTGDINLLRIASDIMHTSLKSYLMIADNLLDFNATELLNRITVPTLVISGTEDSIFPPKVAAELASRIRKSKLDMVKGANHIIVVNNPNDLAVEIHEYLQLN